MALYVNPRTGSLRDVIIWIVEELKKLKAQIYKLSQGGIGIPEAPIDGEQYARQDAGWSVVTGGGSQDLQSVVNNGNTLNGNSISNSNGTRTSNLNNQGLNFYDSTTLYYSQLTHNSIVFSNGDGKLANLFYTGGNGTYIFPDKPNGYYTIATLDDIPNPISTAFVNETYASTMSLAYDAENPNFEIHLTGDLDLTLTGTSNGDSGLLNLYFSGSEIATLNGVENLVLTGIGEKVSLYFMHDSDGLKWYNPISESEPEPVVLTDYVKLTTGKNLFDITKVISGSEYDYTTQTLNIHPSLRRTGFIAITPSTAYKLTSGYGNDYVFFDIDKVQISQGTAASFTSPSDAYYILINLDSATLSTTQLELGSVSTTYVAYQPTLQDVLNTLQFLPRPRTFQHYSHPEFIGRDVNNIITYNAPGVVEILRKDFIQMNIGDIIYLEIESGITMYITTPVGVTLNGVDNAALLLTGNGGLKRLIKDSENAYSIIT